MGCGRLSRKTSARSGSFGGLLSYVWNCDRHLDGSFLRYRRRGAWDNAKKYIGELGNFAGGKNSEVHKASVTGDTFGDPFKDTAGPSFHVVIKLLSTTILVAVPIFIMR